MALEDQYYSGARQEIITRLTLRDTIFGGYLAFLGVMLGLRFGDNATDGVLLAIPFIAAAVSVLVAQHHVMIGRLARYLQLEFTAQLTPSQPRQHFECSRAFAEIRHFATVSRTVVHMIVLQGSASWALLATWRWVQTGARENLWFWLAALALNLFAVYVTVRGELMRGDTFWRRLVARRK